MPVRTVRVRTFFSVKGGVGKSSLAVACAKLLGRRAPGSVVLIDADVTGTSLADGLNLCAPTVALRDGAIDFEARPTGFLSAVESTQARNRRAVHMYKADDAAPRLPPPYLNDLLVYPLGGAVEVDPSGCLWRHEVDDGVRYLPSSPTVADLSLATRWLTEEGRDLWSRQLAWLVVLLLRRDPGLTDIVVDLPPGTTGVVHDTLELFNHLSDVERPDLPAGYPKVDPQEFEVHFDPVLVLTQDRNDLRIAAEWYARNRPTVPTLRMLANRITDPIHHVKDSLEGCLRAMGLQWTLRVSGVGLLSASLGRVFHTEHNLSLTREVDAIARAIGVEESP